MIAFKVGDRVRVKADRADGFCQPWRGRFEKGRVGTVTKVDAIGGPWERVSVLWDTKRGTNAAWTLSMHKSDIELDFHDQDATP